MKEDAFLEEIIKKAEVLKNDQVGIGDDSAYIFVPEGSILITQDSFVEGIHFPLNFPLNYSIKRAFYASISDINAMGGRTKYLILTFGLNEKNFKKANIIFDSLFEECKNFDVKVIGGDTVYAKNNFFTITAIGTLPAGKKPIKRSGAKVGDKIYISGPIGSGGISIKLVRKEIKLKKDLKEKYFNFFVKPKVNFFLGEELLFSGKVNSCIDISDGLSIDLFRICRRSNCGAIIYLNEIPFDENLLKIFKNEKERIDFLLSSGEEFQLIFTSPFELNYKKIGEIISENQFYLMDGRKKYKLKPLGYDHFKIGRN